MSRRKNLATQWQVTTVVISSVLHQGQLGPPTLVLRGKGTHSDFRTGGYGSELTLVPGDIRYQCQVFSGHPCESGEVYDFSEKGNPILTLAYSRLTEMEGTILGSTECKGRQKHLQKA